MVVVVSIILIILSIAVPAASTMWRQHQAASNLALVRSTLRTAANRSLLWHNHAYGVLFYIDPEDNLQSMAFVKAIDYPKTDEENWIDVADRFEIDIEMEYPVKCHEDVLVTSIDSLRLTAAEFQVTDYRTDPHPNYFVIMFRRGEIDPLSFFFVDEDVEGIAGSDGFGDVTHLEVGTTIAPASQIPPSGGTELKDVISASDGSPLRFRSEFGAIVYSKEEFSELFISSLDDISHRSIAVTPRGKVIILEREE